MFRTETAQSTEIGFSLDQSNSEELLAAALSSTDLAEQMAHEAFCHRGGQTWRRLQFILYGMNLRLMRDGFGLGTVRCAQKWRLRNTVERVEQLYMERTRCRGWVFLQARWAP